MQGLILLCRKYKYAILAYDCPDCMLGGTRLEKIPELCDQEGLELLKVLLTLIVFPKVTIYKSDSSEIFALMCMSIFEADLPFHITVCVAGTEFKILEVAPVPQM